MKGRDGWLAEVEAAAAEPQGMSDAEKAAQAERLAGRLSGSERRELLDHFDPEAFKAHCWHSSEHIGYYAEHPELTIDPRYQPNDPDGCDYCYVGPMLTELRQVWETGSEEAFTTMWSMSDGYGEPGLIPEQGYDWSGIRDSSPATIREMWEAIHA